MIPRRKFREILLQLRDESCTAEDIVEAVGLLKKKEYAQDVANYLLKKFGSEAAITRVLIRAAGKTKTRELHDILAQRLMSREGAEFAYELIDALAGTGNQEYAAAIIPFLDSKDESVWSTAAFALGMLKAPIAVLPLVKRYRRTPQSTRSKALVLKSLQQILGNGRKSSLSLDLYLADSPGATREKIREAI